MLRFWDKDTGPFGTGDASGADLELFGDGLVLGLELLAVLGLTDFFELNASHFEEECGFAHTRNPGNQYAVLVLDLFFFLNNLFLRPVDLVNIENLDLLPNLPPEINLFLVGCIGRFNLVDVLEDFLVKSQVVQQFLDLLDVV
jgi:hypothetical protein